MDGRSTIIVSDVHLGEIPPDSEGAFLEFLESLPGRTEELLINGDLFDFWFEYRNVVLRRYFPVLRRLVDIVEAGVRIRLVGGNHDGWTGSFLRGDIGIELLDGPVNTELAGRAPTSLTEMACSTTSEPTVLSGLQPAAGSFAPCSGWRLPISRSLWSGG